MNADGSEPITLTFHGPFKFTRGPNYLFTSEFALSEGIYLWTIKDEKSNKNYVHYIGETYSFAKRQREHLIGMTGLDYRIIDPDCARQGIEEILWNGLWRNKSPEAVATLLNQYDEVSKKVVEYIGQINVNFAPTTCDIQMRRHLEGCLGWNLRKKYQDLTIFYPADNHVGTGERTGQKLIVNLPEAIAGMDREQTV